MSTLPELLELTILWFKKEYPFDNSICGATARVNYALNMATLFLILLMVLGLSSVLITYLTKYHGLINN